MKVEFAFWARSVRPTKQGMDISGMGTPKLAFADLPSVVPTLGFFAVLSFADDEQESVYPMQGTILDPGGHAVISRQFDVARGEEPQKTELFTFSQFPVDREGTHVARFEAGEQRREWRFVVSGVSADRGSQ